LSSCGGVFLDWRKTRMMMMMMMVIFVDVVYISEVMEEEEFGFPERVQVLVGLVGFPKPTLITYLPSFWEVPQ
jgi:hypothetical protein